MPGDEKEKIARLPQSAKYDRNSETWAEHRIGELFAEESEEQAPINPDNRRMIWSKLDTLRQNESGEIVAVTRHLYFPDTTYEISEQRLAFNMTLTSQMNRLCKLAELKDWKDGPEPDPNPTREQLNAEHQDIKNYVAAMFAIENMREALIAVQREKLRLGLPLDTEALPETRQYSKGELADVRRIDEIAPPG